CGNIGKDLVRLLEPFECKIIVYDIQEYTEFYKKYNIITMNLEELIRESDIVTLHVPLNDTTRNILDRERLALMKKGSFLINTARGGLIDEDALKEMLKNGHLSGAALDVLSIEPPEDMELLNLPNVIVTPHIGGSTEEAILAMGRAAIRGLDCAKRVREVVPFYLR
ncbi:MAG: hypothetical protein N2596_08500, partial [Syntrophorhabdaceae bacterium]|nr:hypothetical protein [Syntrophorhabdaceae bacterium]